MRTLLMLAACLTLLSCRTLQTPKPTIELPPIDCSARAPAEPAPRKPSSTQWQTWAAWGTRWMGVAQAEVEKRAAIADCEDRYVRDANRAIQDKLGGK